LPLEARTAQYWSTLGRLERNRGFLTALRARSARLRTDPPATGTLRLALLAVLRIVLELFVVKEELLAGGEYKLSAAVITFQNSVFKFHGRLPQYRDGAEIGHGPQLAGPVSLFSYVEHVTRARAATKRRLFELSFRLTGRPS